MVVVIVALTAGLLAVVLLLAVPVTLVFQVERTESVRATGRVRWLFGMVDVGFDGPSPARPRRRRKATPSRVRPGGVLAAMRTPGLFRRVARLLADLRRQVHGEGFHLWARFGFDDPADTGRVYGALAPVLVTASRRGWNIRCEPRFTDPCLIGSCGATLRVRPLTVVGLGTAFFFSRPVLRAMLAMRPRR